MINLEQVALKDVSPSGVNPRQDFGDIEALAKSFAGNTERPGEPVNPPLLVKDGKRFLIVDGERRYRAMLEAGTKVCTANVCDSLDEANQILDMLATDDKMKLNDLERSQGVQQALLLGVEPSVVASVVNRPTIDIERAGKGAKVLAALKRKGSPKSYSIDRLIAISELEELGLKKAIKTVEKADDDEWRYAAFEAKAQIELDELALILITVLEIEGVTSLEEDPGWNSKKYERIDSYIGSASELKKKIKEAQKDHSELFAFVSTGSVGRRWGAGPDSEPGHITKPTCSLWALSGKSAKATQQSNEQKLANKLKRGFKDARVRRGRFVAERLDKHETDLVHTASFVLAHLDYRLVGDTKAFNDQYGTAVEWTPSPAVIAYTFAGNENINDKYPDILGIIQKEASDNYYNKRMPSGTKHYIELLEALKADGYEPDEGELELYRHCVDCVLHYEKKGGEGDE